VGSFGTEAERPKPLPGKVEYAMKTTNVRPVANENKFSERQRDALELRLNKETKLQALITNAFRGLKAQNNNSNTERSVNDRPLASENILVAHSILDVGLMAKWEPPKVNLVSDRPHRPDDVAHAVGTRALQSLLKGPLAPDIQDLPKIERELVSVALGRTILNALTLRPQQSGPQTELADRPKFDELVKSLSLSISPAILNGIVAPELLSDRTPKDQQAVSRTTQPAQKAMSVPNRHTVVVNQKPEQDLVRPVQRAHPNANKKNLFFCEDTSNRREIAHSGPEKQFTVQTGRTEVGSFSRRPEQSFKERESFT
jgi:hypothetical protein